VGVQVSPSAPSFFFRLRFTSLGFQAQVFKLKHQLKHPFKH